MNDTPVNVYASCVLMGTAFGGLAAGGPASGGLAAGGPAVGRPSLGTPEDAGILILGESGVGKSAITLGIIARGGRLVADDHTLISARDGALWAEPHPRLAGLIEAREVGIVHLPYVAPAKIALAVELVPGPRMPLRRDFHPEGVPVESYLPPPLLQITPDGGCIDKILLAVAAFAGDAFISNENL